MADNPSLPTDPDADRVPNPHRDEPVPAPQEGMRPGADATVRPEQDEPLGPLAGLMTASAAEVDAEASEVVGGHDAEAEALLASMGVEDEGIEGGQLLGLVAGTLASVVALAIVLIYLFYIPFRTQVGVRAEGEVTNYEQENLRTEALAKLGQYTRTDDTYGLPIGRAMGVVAAGYGATATGERVPTTRAGWNVLWPDWSMGTSVQPSQAGLDTRPVAPVGDGVERVGVDVPGVDTVELIENDGAIDADDAVIPPATIDDN